MRSAQQPTPNTLSIGNSAGRATWRVEPPNAAIRPRLFFVPYMFWNRVATANKFLAVDAEKWPLSNDGAPYKVQLQSGDQKLIKDTHDLVLAGSGYPDEDAAYADALIWRQIVAAYLPRLGISVEIGSDSRDGITPHKPNLPRDMRAALGIGDDRTIYQDDARLYVIESDDNPAFSYGRFDMVVSVPLREDKLELLTQTINRNQQIWSPELTLSYDLINASLGATNPQAKYVLMVTAIEALIPYRERPADVVAALDHLIEYTDRFEKFDNDLRDVVEKLLNGAKLLSVRQFGLRLADRLTGEYAGLLPRKFFDSCYKNRSDIVHGNERDEAVLGEYAIYEQLPELQRFVTDLVDAWTPDFSVGGNKLE